MQENNENIGTILFVDDEKFILDLMKDFLADSPFHILTAQSPTRALDILQSVHVHLVVSDYSMPDMNGAEFLNAVKTRYPHIRRILVSGYMNTMDAVVRLHENTAIAVYDKPWDFSTLKQQLQNALTLCQLLHNAGLLTLINTTAHLPTLPTLYEKYQTAVQDGASMQVLARLIRVDPSVSAEVVRLANSAFLGHQQVKTLDQAMVKVGLNAVQYILLSVLLVDQMEWTPAQREALPEIFQEFALTNYGVTALYQELYREALPAELSVVGLIYQIGRILLLGPNWSQYQAAESYRRDQPGTIFIEAEEARGYTGQSSAELSSYLLAWWNFSPDLVQLAREYRTPDSVQEPYQTIARLVLVIEQIVSQITHGTSPDNIELPHVSGINLTGSIHQEIVLSLTERYKKLQNVFHQV